MSLSWVWPLFLVWSFLGSPEPVSCSISIIPYHSWCVGRRVEASPGQRSLEPAEGCGLLSSIQLTSPGAPFGQAVLRAPLFTRLTLEKRWDSFRPLPVHSATLASLGMLGVPALMKDQATRRPIRSVALLSEGEAQGWQQNLRNRGTNAEGHQSRDTACSKELMSLTVKGLGNLGACVVCCLLSDMEYITATRPLWITEFKSLIYQRRNWSPGHCD